MNRITIALGRRNASFESAEVGDETIDEQLVKAQETADENTEILKDHHEEIASAHEDLVSLLSNSDNLEGLVDGVIKIHEEKGIDEQSAAALQVSVEALLRVAGLNIPATVVLPSFESAGANYATEAEEKKSSVVTRLKEAAIKAWKLLVSWIMKMINHFRKNTESLKDYANTLGKKIDAMKASPKPDVKLTLGADSKYVLHGGVPGRPSAVIHENVTKFAEFATGWAHLFEPINKIVVDYVNPQRSGEAIDTAFSETATRFFDANVNTPVFFTPTVFKSILFRLEKPASPTSVAKVIFDNRDLLDDKKPAQVDVLEFSELDKGISAALVAITAIEGVQKTVGVWEKQLEKVVKDLDALIAHKQVAAASKPQLDLMSKMMGANAHGWSMGLISINAVVKTNLDYIAKSAEKYSSAGSLNTVAAPQRSHLPVLD